MTEETMTEVQPTPGRDKSTIPPQVGEVLSKLDLQQAELMDAAQRNDAVIDREKQYQRQQAIAKAEKKAREQLGERYVNCTLDNFRVQTEAQEKVIGRLQTFAERMPDFVSTGGGVVFFGSVGTGKDHLMAALVRVAIVHHGYSARWVNGLDLFGAFRDRMQTSEPESKLVSAYAKPSILAISDPIPPKGDSRPYNLEILFRIIDQRYRQNRSTWVTLNVATKEESIERLSPSIRDRLLDGSGLIHCDWPSFREERKSPW